MLVYKKNKILRMEERRKLHSLTQVHKSRKGIGPEYLLNKLKCRKDTHDHNTRRRNDFEVSHAKKDLNKSNCFNKSLMDYNNILTLETGRKLRNTDESEKLFNVKDSINTFKKSLEITYCKRGTKIEGNNIHFCLFTFAFYFLLF